MAEIGYNDSISGLIKGVLMDIRELLREEIALARVELSEKATRAKLAVASLGAAAVALAFGAVFLLISIAIGIADLLDWPVWTGFLIVALLLSVCGLVMLSSGRKRLQTLQPMPEETVQTIKENSEWLKRRLSSASR